MSFSSLRYLAVSAGKRKRGRERSVEWCGSNHLSHSKRHGSSASHFHNLRMHRSSQPTTENNMDYDYSDEANMYVYKLYYLQYAMSTNLSQNWRE